jgi:membrane protease subunit (stomatin/prohibitin family)
MGLWDKIRGEFVDIIQWLDDDPSTVVYRFERLNNQIKYGAKLTVREGQVAVFVNEGRIADVFGPGMVTLETKNLPILSTLLGWKYGFNSPFVSEVYFVKTTRFTDQKWGTREPVTLRDADFGIVRLRAFGTYDFKVGDAGKFIKEIVGTDGRFTVDQITNQIRNIMIARFSDAMAESRKPFLDMASNLNEFGDFMSKHLRGELEAYGVELMKFLVENINVPEEVQKAIDQRSSMGAVGDLRAFTQYQTAQAIGDAARNPGGVAGAGAGLGAGFVMAQQMGQAMAGPPPLPGAAAGTVTFYAALGGQQQGPFALPAIQQYVASGQITRETLVWRPGMAQWAPAAQVPEIAQAFAAVPPPLPPPGGPPPLKG